MYFMIHRSIFTYLSWLSLLVSYVASQSANSSSLTGGSTCNSYMCIIATVNSTDVQYVLQSKSSSTIGWMAIGFGTLMTNAPMVIMWPNADGTITLSQRSASGHAMPTVQTNPPRVASLQYSSTNLKASNPQMAFTIPKNSDTIQNIIWAYSSVNPQSSAVDVSISMHSGFASTTINLTGNLSSSGTPLSTSSSSSPPLSLSQQYIVAHAVLCVVGFLLLLPLGALIGRYLRTSTNVWFKAHWVTQVIFAGPVIVAGVFLGSLSTAQSGGAHLDDVHKKLGLAIFVLYIAQCIYGYLVHKFPASSFKHRPIQNYGHAIVGLTTIALSLYQIRTGYVTEWAMSTGRGGLPKSLGVVWLVWVILLPVLYFAGLAFLPRQYRQEKESRARKARSTRRHVRV